MKNQIKQYEIDNKKLNDDLANLMNTLDTLERENLIFKNNTNKSSQLELIIDELDNWKNKYNKLTIENNTLKNDFESLNDKFNNLNDNIKIEEENNMSRMSFKVPILDDNNLTLLFEFIKNTINNQLQDIQRVGDNDSQIKHQEWTEKSISNLPKNLTNIISKNPLVHEIINLMDNLSFIISKMNSPVIQKIEDTKMTMKSELSKPREMKNSFDPETWLKSLTFSQLVDVHDLICDLTSSIVDRNNDICCCSKKSELAKKPNRKLLEMNYEILSRKIVDLEEKQSKKDRQVHELRYALDREKAELAKISNEINRKNKINEFNDASVCRINNCMAKCSKHPNFNSK
ncbi:transcription factor stalky-like [Aphidius gifuensis]|nr:transcription factor stalky-like [Aphidius gifuensis]